MGPDITLAREQGRVVGEELLARLIKDNNLWDITKTRNEESIQLFKSKVRWIKVKREFIRAVEELFVEDACNGF
jgi:hypothetical protein